LIRNCLNWEIWCAYPGNYLLFSRVSLYSTLSTRQMCLPCELWGWRGWNHKLNAPLFGPNFFPCTFICNALTRCCSFLTLLKYAPTTRFNMRNSVSCPYTVYLCVPYGSHNKQRLFP
jgi:hypothetical protein